MATFTLIVTTEPKDECAAGAGREPDAAELARVATDYLADVTKHEWDIPWRVLSVRSAS
jgi:hypothetical protein